MAVFCIFFARFRAYTHFSNFIYCDFGVQIVTEKEQVVVQLYMSRKVKVLLSRKILHPFSLHSVAMW